MQSQQLKKEQVVYLGLDPDVTVSFNVSFIFKLTKPYHFLLAGSDGLFIINYLTNYIRIRSQFFRVEWACQSPSGKIYLADSHLNHFIQIDNQISKCQHFLQEYPFSSCSGMVVDENNSLYFADYPSSTIYMLDLQPLKIKPIQIINPQISIQKLNRRVSPIGLCISGKYLFFIDNNAKEILKYNLQDQSIDCLFNAAYGQPFGLLRNLHFVADRLLFQDIQKHIVFSSKLSENEPMEPLNFIGESDNIQSYVQVTENRLLTLKGSCFLSRLRLISI